MSSLRSRKLMLPVGVMILIAVLPYAAVKMITPPAPHVLAVPVALPV